MDGNAYNQPLRTEVVVATNHIVPVDGDAYHQRLPIGMGHADNLIVPVYGSAYSQRLRIRTLPPINHNVPTVADMLELSQLESDYTNHTKYILKCLYIYVPFQAAVLLYVPQKTEGCEIWRWCPLILSSLASIVMTALYFQYVVQQFGLLKRGRQLQERRDLLVETFPQNWRLRLFSTYGSRTVFQEVTNCWWTAQRITFLLMLSSSSVFLSLFCTRLLC